MRASRSTRRVVLAGVFSVATLGLFPAAGDMTSAFAAPPAPMRVRVAPTVRVTVSRGEALAITIPVPGLLHASDSIAFAVNRSLRGVVGGAGNGTFMSGGATVPVTVRVPRDHAAGTFRLADVRFWSADGRGERIIIPIELTVPDVGGSEARLVSAPVLGAPSSVSATPAFVGTSAPPAEASPAGAPAVRPSFRTIRVAPSVSMPAAPRSVQVVSIAMPAELMNHAGPLAYTVERTDGASVAGPTVGVLEGRDARVLLTVSVPSRALAGPQRVAVVRFEPAASDAPVVHVPVEVVVPTVRALSVAASSPQVHAVPGRKTSLRVVVSNAGNVHDTVALALALPDDWRGVLSESPRVALAPGASASREILLTAPREQLPGVTSLSLHAVRSGARDGDEVDAAARQLVLPVEVIPATRGQTFGPVLGLSYSAVQVPGQTPIDSWGLTLSGPIARDVVLQGAWTQRAIVGTPGLARVGGGQLFPTLSLLHPRWRLDAGNAAAEFGDLGGTMRSGRGLSIAMGDTLWQLQALAARPFLFGSATDDAGALAGARFRLRRGGIAWSAGASHLRDPLLLQAQLDAVSVGAERVVVGGTDARGELAWRRWADGAGLGGAAELGRRGDQGDWRLRATYAPGGSRAFARAQSDITFTGGLKAERLRLGDLRLGYVGWYADDESVGGVSQSTWGAGVMPQWRLGRKASLGLEARAGRTVSGNETARQSTMTQILGLFASTRLGAATATTGANVSHLQRSLAFPDLDASETSERQLNWTAQLLVPLAYGTLDLFSSLQRRFGASVFTAGQHDVTLRAEQIAVPFSDGRLRLGAAIGRITSLETGAHVTTQRVGLSAALPFDLQVRVDLERNPWLRAAGTTGWTTAFRIDRSFGTPGFLRFGRGAGVVFEDRNGNGVRDRGERGIAGALVRVGGEVVVTDQGGTYHLSRPGAGIAELDERSLPFGYMLAPQAGRATVSGLRDAAADIPVVPVGVVEVALTVETDSLRGALSIPLEAVIVSAVDARGRRLVAGPVVGGRTTFEALPPGEYRLEIDAAGAPEPLVLQGEAPIVRIDGTQQRQNIRIVLGPRRVRLFRAAPAVRSSSGAR